jgi:hypothetical protein
MKNVKTYPCWKCNADQESHGKKRREEEEDYPYLLNQPA